MVKLLRLTTDDNNGIFQANFKNPITLEPQSQLALLHFTAQVKLQTIAISFENNLISFTIAGRTYSGRLKRGTYGRANYVELLEDIQNVMNLSCVYDETLGNASILGVEWSVADVDNRINIGYEYNLSGGYNNFLEHVDQINSLANDVWSLDTLVPNPQANYNYAVIGKKSVSIGNGYVRSRIVNLANEDPAVAFAEQGFVVGLTKSDLTNRSPNSLTQNEINYGIGIGYNAGAGEWRYYTQIDGVITEYTDAVNFIGNGNATNPTLEVMKNGNNVDFAYYQEVGQTRTILDSVALTENLELFPFLVFHSNNDVVRTNLKWIPTTEITNSNSALDTNDLGATQRNSGAKVNANLEFGSITLANFLGYQNTTTPTTLSKFHNFVAAKEFDVKKLLNPYILELLNLNVESFDSQLEQRKNIIASVLTADDNGVINNEGNVIFIDLNNKDKIDLRNISVRLVGLDYTKVELDGRSICALLIGDKTATSF